jgi:hypothetical protein
MEERRHVQAAADSAALAAAADLLANYSANKGADPSGTAASSAQSTAAANGFSNDGVNSIVTVSISPQKYQGGPKAGHAIPTGYAEVIIQYNAGRSFSGVFGSGTIPVRARAVARGEWASAGNAVSLLNLSSSSVLSLTGSAGLNVNGALQVNSSSPSALNLAGIGNVTASLINVNAAAGPLSGLLALLGLGGGSPTINYGNPVPDPLRYSPAPDPVQLGLTLQATNASYSGGSVDLYPGVYKGGITVNGTATVVLHTNTDGSPGIYYLQGGGLTVTNRGSVTTAAGETAGVMIYNDWQSSIDAIDVKGLGSLTLTPPASGLYQGIGIFQKRGTLSDFTSGNVPALSFTGRGALNIAGTIYASYANISAAGNTVICVMGGQIIADSLSLSGSGTISVNSGTSPTANGRYYGLVE